MASDPAAPPPAADPPPVKRGRGRPPKKVPPAAAAPPPPQQLKQWDFPVDEAPDPDAFPYEYAKLCPFLDESAPGLSPGDLVWGQVLNRPWWPGMVLPPEAATEATARIPRKGGEMLVAYFGEGSAGWAGEAGVAPYSSNFGKMVRQQDAPASFHVAIAQSLDEVARRIELCLGCNERRDEAVGKAGIKEAVLVPEVDRAFVVNALNCRRVVEFLGDLAVLPSGGCRLLDTVILKAQLRGFNRWRGVRDGPEFLDYGLDDEMVPGTGRKRKVAGAESGDSSGSGKRKVRKGFGNYYDDSDWDPEVPESLARSPAGRRGRPKKSGASAQSQGANTSDGSDEEIDEGKVRKPGKRGRPRKNAVNTRARGGDVDPSEHSEAKQKSAASTPRKQKSTAGLQESDATISTRARVVDVGAYSPGQMLTQLCSAAKDPMQGQGVDSEVQGFFAEYKDSLLPASCEDKALLYNLKAKRPRGRPPSGRQKKTVPSDVASDDSYAVDSNEEEGDEDKTLSKRERRKKVNDLFDYGGDSSEEETSGGRRTRKRSQADPDKKSRMQQINDLFDYGGDDSDDEPATSGRKGRKGSRGKKDIKASEVEDEEKGTGAKTETKRARKKAVEDVKPLDEFVAPAEPLNAEQAMANARLLNNYDEKPDECMPTALTLNFTNPDAIPSEFDLVTIFSVYGPLREEETEVMRKSNSAKVVFKRRADAEAAYNSSGKYTIFGPAFTGYKLSLVTSPTKGSNPSVSNADPLHTEGINLDIPVPGSDFANFGGDFFGSNGGHFFG